MLDLFSLSVLALLTVHLSEILLVSPCFINFSGNIFLKFASVRQFSANLRLITSLLFFTIVIINMLI